MEPRRAPRDRCYRVNHDYIYVYSVCHRPHPSPGRVGQWLLLADMLYMLCMCKSARVSKSKCENGKRNSTRVGGTTNCCQKKKKKRKKKKHQRLPAPNHYMYTIKKTPRSPRDNAIRTKTRQCSPMRATASPSPTLPLLTAAGQARRASCPATTPSRPSRRPARWRRRRPTPTRRP
jgi:hypothetical protein